MCRVLVVNRSDFNLFNNKYGVLALLNHLEKECGGHGNGYALIKNRRITETRKGVKLDNKDIYNRVRTASWDWLLYHTRIASIGDASDVNCHPYVSDDDCLAMNGTEYSLRTLSGAMKRTDSEVIFRNLIGSSASEASTALLDLSSVFIGCASGIPYAVKAEGSLCKWNMGDGTMHVSSLSANVKKKEVETLPAGYMWVNGKEDRQFVKKPRVMTGTEYFRSKYGLNSIYTGASSYWDDIDDEAEFGTKKESVPEGMAKPVTSGEWQGSYNAGYDAGYDEGYEDAMELAQQGDIPIDEEDDEEGEAILSLPGRDSKYNEGWCDGRAVGQDEGYEACAKDMLMRKGVVV